MKRVKWPATAAMVLGLIGLLGAILGASIESIIAIGFMGVIYAILVAGSSDRS